MLISSPELVEYAGAWAQLLEDLSVTGPLIVSCHSALDFTLRMGNGRQKHPVRIVYPEVLKYPLVPRPCTPIFSMLNARVVKRRLRYVVWLRYSCMHAQCLVVLVRGDQKKWLEEELIL